MILAGQERLQSQDRLRCTAMGAGGNEGEELQSSVRHKLSYSGCPGMLHILPFDVDMASIPRTLRAYGDARARCLMYAPGEAQTFKRALLHV